MTEPARKIEYPTDAHEKADELLAKIGKSTAEVIDLHEQYEERVRELRAMFKSPIAAHKSKITTLSKSLEKLMKINRYRLFDGTDRANLAHGALMFAIEERVKRAKDILKRLEEGGAEEMAFVITKSVNWDYLETWTDERLIEVGAERKKEEKFSWEIFVDKKSTKKG